MFLQKFSERVVGVLGRDVMVSVISFSVTTYIANTLGVEGFGLWIGVITLLTMFDLIFRLKLDQLIIFYSRQYPFNHSLYKKISLLSLCGVLIGAILVLSFHNIPIKFFNLSSDYFLLLIFCTFALSVFGNIAFYIFLAESSFLTYNFCILGQSITVAVFVFILFYFFESSIYVPLISHLLSWIFVLLFFLIYKLKGRNDNMIDAKKSISLTKKAILVKGSYTYSSEGISALAGQLPRLFSINYLSAAFVGHFGLAIIIVGLINRIPGAINTVLYPMLVRETGNELNRTASIIRALLIIFIPLIILMELFIPFLINIFYGEDFATASSYVQICLPFIYFGLPGLILSPYFASKGEFGKLLIINSITVLIAVLSLYFVNLISREIAPLVSMCSTFISLTTSSLFFAAKHVSPMQFIPTSKDLHKLYHFTQILMPSSSIK